MRVDPDKDFGTRACPGCATDVPANSNRCPICGYAFPHPTSRQRVLRLGGALLMLGLLLLLFLLRYLR